MNGIKIVIDDIFWIGGSDRRLARFENIFPIPPPLVSILRLGDIQLIEPPSHLMLSPSFKVTST